ncbi:MAG: NAD(P)H-dependent oxidoreductase [Erysipelotrichaceae bacterium]|nr:NAD(P)H-dependent oxidoreductase [Erysipelotrichaceae bacterium]
MSKIIVAYFSATGTTKNVAEKLAKVVDCDLFEIVPKEKYTSADLNWQNPKSRSSYEMKDNPNFRPSISSHVNNIDQYDTIFLGFPIWWYVAPTIINTFLESYDLSNKKIVVFATSGSSGLGNTIKKLQESTNAAFVSGARLNASISKTELQNWVKTLKY